ncbi:MAG: hypothetical protein KC609_03030 [Myxococcales bacterium]|nr:hypothetical protein [Myxococcales bacterium]
MSERAFTRIVDAVQIHEQPLTPEQLFARVITDETKYLVLDLDRTIHRGINIGERFGWELVANQTYGIEYMQRADERRGASRFFFDWRSPLRSGHYLARGLRLWAYPGLYYFFFGKLASRYAWTRRLQHRYFGQEPIREVQTIPRVALMHHLSELPLEPLRRIMRRLWRRLAPFQVFTRDDFERLRRRHPRLRIIISSASPQPVLEVAAEELGVDGVIYTAIEEHDGFLSSPHHYEWRYLLLRRPRRIAPPQSLQHNASLAKRVHLLERYPDFCEVETVGISDTAYGEDHEWANFCTRVVDVNSPTPFPPVVDADSPLRELHSVRMLPHSERGDSAGRAVDSAAHGEEPSRRAVTASFDRDTLQRKLGALAQHIESLAREYHERASVLAASRGEIEAELATIRQRIEAIVADYNSGRAAKPNALLSSLRQALTQQRRLQRRQARLLRPLALLKNAIREDATLSRALLAPA